MPDKYKAFPINKINNNFCDYEKRDYILENKVSLYVYLSECSIESGRICVDQAKTIQLFNATNEKISYENMITLLNKIIEFLASNSQENNMIDLYLANKDNKDNWLFKQYPRLIGLDNRKARQELYNIKTNLEKILSSINEKISTIKASNYEELKTQIYAIANMADTDIYNVYETSSIITGYEKLRPRDVQLLLTNGTVKLNYLAAEDGRYKKIATVGFVRNITLEEVYLKDKDYIKLKCVDNIDLKNERNITNCKKIRSPRHDEKLQELITIEYKNGFKTKTFIEKIKQYSKTNPYKPDIIDTDKNSCTKLYIENDRLFYTINCNQKNDISVGTIKNFFDRAKKLSKNSQTDFQK